MKKQIIITAIILYMLALLPRVTIAWLKVVPVAPDSSSYIIPGINFMRELKLKKNSHLDATRPPVYPLFIGIVYSLFDRTMTEDEPFKNILLIEIVQGLLASFLAPLIFFIIYSRTKNNYLLSLFGGLLYSFDPLLLASTNFILSECTGGIIIFFLWVIMERLRNKPTWVFAFIAGFLGSIAGLNTPIAILLLPFLVFVFFIEFFRKKGIFIILIIMSLTYVMFPGIWFLRNLTKLKKVAVVRTLNFGTLLWATTEYDFRWLPSPYYPPFKEKIQDYIVYQTERLKDDEVIHYFFLKKAYDNIKRHPVRSVWRFIKADFWFWVDVPGAMLSLQKKQFILWSMRIWHNMIHLLFISGTIFLIRNKRIKDYLLLYATLFYFSLFLAPLMPIPRYFLPVLPLEIVIAGYGLAHLKFFHKKVFL